MSRNRIILIVSLAIIVLVGGIWAFNAVLGRPEEASAPIEAVPLAEVPENTEPPPTATEIPPTEEPTETPTPLPTEMIIEEEATLEPTNTPEPTPTPEPTLTPIPTDTPTPEPILFEIDPEQSQVSFTLGELLAGEPKTVVGITDQVAGQIAIAFEDLSSAQVGVILVNARTLATDSNFRNRSIRNLILETDSYEFITFTPTSIDGLPDSAAVGDSVTFQIVGDLTIREITNQVTFETTVDVISSTEIKGFATTIVLRGDYDLVIPEVEGVANVDEEVVLAIDFIAQAIETTEE